MQKICLAIYLFQKKKIPLDRANEDKGRINLLIANGRIFNDQGIGKTTCKNVSLVDYLLLTPNLFDVISDFDIIEFNPMFADVHNRIHFNLSLSNRVIDNSEINLDTPGCIKKPRIKWKPNKANDFIHVLIDDHNDVLVNINNVLDEFDNRTQVSKPKVNGLVNDLCNFMCNTASTVFGTNSENRHHNKNNSNSKPWFTKDCKTKRDAFHGVKNKFKTDKSDETKFLLKEKS